VGDRNIACALDGAAMGDRIGEWQAVLDAATERTELDGGLRITFRGADAPAADLARLAVAEHACCSFFSFALTVDARGVALEVTAPPDSQPVLRRGFGTNG